MALLPNGNTTIGRKGMWQRKRVAGSLLGALLVLFVTGGIRAQGPVQLSPAVLTVPWFPGNGQLSLSLISGDSDTNRFVFKLALADFGTGLGSGAVFIRSTAASISSATVIDQGDFVTLTTLIQVPERVDVQVVNDTPSAVAVLEIQFQGTPTHIEFFNSFGDSVTATLTALIVTPPRCSNLSATTQEDVPLEVLLSCGEGGLLDGLEVGYIRTVAGNGSPGWSGDGGPATFAMLNSPTGVAIDSSGNMYIADKLNHLGSMWPPAR
jgi:hypothetical protein